MQTAPNNLEFKRKIYCNHYIKKLLEEIVLQPNPVEVHYGKCAIIGKTIYNTKKQCFYLKNLRFAALDTTRHKSIDGQYQILLLTSSSRKPLTPPDKYVEVFGEVGFILKNDRICDNSKTMASSWSSNEFILKLGKLQIDLEDELGLKQRLSPSGLSDPNLNENIRNKLLHKLNEFQQKYEPAFIVHNWFLTPQAHELIKINMICKLASNRFLK